MSTRREFFKQAPAAGLAASGVLPDTPQPMPTVGWAIMGYNWEYNDNYLYDVGEPYMVEGVFLDKARAELRCKEMNDNFFATENPEDYSDGALDKNTWEEFQEINNEDYGCDFAPYFVRETVLK